jgi:hypothetical protein
MDATWIRGAMARYLLFMNGHVKGPGTGLVRWQIVTARTAIWENRCQCAFSPLVENATGARDRRTVSRADFIFFYEKVARTTSSAAGSWEDVRRTRMANL